MKHSNLDRLSDDELIGRFAVAAKKMGKAVLDSETRRANRAFDTMWDIDHLLRARGKNARLKLLPLLEDENRFVRYYAAKKLLGLMPDPARAILEWNYQNRFDALAGDAGMTLLALDRGEYTPD